MLAKEYNFEVIDATPDVRTVFEHLRSGIARVLSGEPREPLFSVSAIAGETPEPAARKVLEMPATGRPAASAVEEPQPPAETVAKAAEGDSAK
jgi:hypothetical protein